MTSPNWVPADELERDLLRARQIQDNDAFLDRLAHADLLLPLAPGDSGDAVRWVTSEISGQRCVVSFTSVAAMSLLPGGESAHRIVRCIELAATWPDPSVWLAVDPGLPIEGYLTPEVVGELAQRAALPATSLERSLDTALAADDPEAYARALLTEDVVLPIVDPDRDSRDVTDPAFAWWRVDSNGPIAVFTSEERLRDHLPSDSLIEVRFASVAAAWPDPAIGLIVDPGTTYSGQLDGQVLAYLGAEVSRIERITAAAIARAQARTELTEPQRFQLAQRLVAEELATPLPPAPPPFVPSSGTPTSGGVPETLSKRAPLPRVPGDGSTVGMGGGDSVSGDAGGRVGPAVQVVILAQQLDRYVGQGHKRVAGLIHRRPEQALSLAALYQWLGLLGEGSPFGHNDEVGYVLRWYERYPDAYPSPTMDGVEVPDGAVILRIDRAGAEQTIASYVSATSRWEKA